MTQEGATLKRKLSLYQLVREKSMGCWCLGNDFKICNLANALQLHLERNQIRLLVGLLK